MDLGIKTMTLRFDDSQLGHIEPVQGDTKSRGYLVEMVSTDGEIMIADKSHECRLYGVNSNFPDKTYFTVAEVVDGRYKVYLSTDMLAKPGTLKLQLALYKGSEELIQSEVKELQVSESMVNGGALGKDLVVDFTRLVEALDRVDTQEKNYKKSLSEQATIKSDIDKKHAQVGSDTKEVREIKTELSTVLDSEEARKKAESARAYAESLRVDAEKSREREENSRVDAENSRIDAEGKRVDAEDVRDAREGQRLNDERRRELAEISRQSNEDARQSQESTRENREKSRQELHEKLSKLQQILGENPTVELAEKVGEIQDEIIDLYKTIPYPKLVENGLVLQDVKIWHDGTNLNYETKDVGFIIDEAKEIALKSTTKEIMFKAISSDDITVLMTDQGEFKRYFKLGRTGRQFKIDVTGVSKIIISCINNLDATVKIWDFEEVE